MANACQICRVAVPPHACDLSSVLRELSNVHIQAEKGVLLMRRLQDTSRQRGFAAYGK